VERRPSQSARGSAEMLPHLTIRPLCTCALLSLLPPPWQAPSSSLTCKGACTWVGPGLAVGFAGFLLGGLVLAFGFSPSLVHVPCVRVSLWPISCMLLRKVSKVSALCAGWGAGFVGLWGFGWVCLVVGRLVGSRVADSLLIRTYGLLRPLRDSFRSVCTSGQSTSCCGR
jgi:hypothetical protein